MTPTEFQRRYHFYRAETKEEALREIEEMEIVGEEIIIPVKFDPPGGWCLMLGTAVKSLSWLGIRYEL